MKSLPDAMLDPELFGPTFSAPSYRNWVTVAKVLEGCSLDESELALYQQLTGRQTPPIEVCKEAYLIKPRRAGGTLFAAAVGLHAALQDYRGRLGPGEVATVAMIASDRRQARQLMNYVKGLVSDSPMIQAEVINDTAESITFSHRVQLEVHTTSFRSTRGYSYVAVILDELAFFRDDLSANPDVELVRAVRPGLANLGGRLLGLSSPHSRRGHLFEMWRQHFGADGDKVLVLQATHSVLNPTIDMKIIEQALAEDPEAARSEWFGEFRGDVSQFLDDVLIDEAIVSGRKYLPYFHHVRYCAFIDPSGGKHDSMTMAIAHREPSAPGAVSERVIVDRLLIQTPPFNPEATVQEFSEAARSFDIRSVTGDRYAGEWVGTMFKKYGISYEACSQDKSTLYAECLPLFTQRLVELPDEPKLLTQLRMLERKPRSGGRADSIDHPPKSHDDAANAVCGALWLATQQRGPLRRDIKRPQYALSDREE